MVVGSQFRGLWLAVGGWWRLAVGGWWSLGAVLNEKNGGGVLKTALSLSALAGEWTQL